MTKRSKRNDQMKQNKVVFSKHMAHSAKREKDERKWVFWESKNDQMEFYQTTILTQAYHQNFGSPLVHKAVQVHGQVGHSKFPKHNP